MLKPIAYQSGIHELIVTRSCLSRGRPHPSRSAAARVLPLVALVPGAAGVARTATSLDTAVDLVNPLYGQTIQLQPKLP